MNSQKSEVADFSALELASILDKTRQTIVRTNEIIGEKDPGSLFHNMKQVHEKQCKAE